MSRFSLSSHLKTLYFSFAVLAFVIASESVWGQRNSVFQPEGTWQANHVNTLSNNTRPYCALARSYKGGIVFSLAQNSEDEISFALDFQEALFQPPNNVRVNLDNGLGRPLSYDVRPVSERALVIRAGQNADFFYDLEKTGYLTVKLDEQEFVFDTTDFYQARQEMDSCLRLITPTRGRTFAGSRQVYNPPAAPAPSVQRESVRAGLPSLQSAPSTTSTVTRQVQNDFTAPLARQEVQAASQASTQPLGARQDYQAVERLYAEIQTLTSELNDLRAENRSLQNYVSSVQQAATPQRIDPNPQLISEMESLRQKNANLERELFLMRRKQIEVQQQSELDYNASFESQQTIERLRRENEELANALEISRQQFEAQARDIRLDKGSVSSALNEKHQEVAFLKEQNRQLEASVRGLETQIHGMQAQNSNADFRFSDLQAENRRLKELVSDLRLNNKRKSLNFQDQDLAILDVENANLKEENENLRRRLNEIASQEQELFSLRQDNQRLQNDKAFLSSKVQASRLPATGVSDVELNVLKTELGFLKRQNLEMVSALESLKIDNKELEKEVLNKDKRVAELELSLNQSNRDVQTYQASLSKLERLNLVKQADLQKDIQLREEVRKERVSDIHTSVFALSSVSMPSTRVPSVEGRTVSNAIIPPRKPESYIRKSVLASLARDTVSSAVIEQSDVPESVSSLEPAAGRDEIIRENAPAKVNSKKADIESVKEPVEVQEVAAIKAKELSAQQEPLELAQYDPDKYSNQAQYFEDKLREQLDNKNAVEPLSKGETKNAPDQEFLAEDISSKSDELSPPNEDISQKLVGGSDDSKSFEAPENDAAVSQQSSQKSTLIEQIVSKSFSSFEEPIQKVRTTSNGSAIFQWKANGVFGSGEQRVDERGENYDRYISAYLNALERRCEGDFAILPSTFDNGSYGRYESYDVACVNNDVSASASILFLGSEDQFIVLAHEAHTEQMEQAMILRDEVLKSFKISSLKGNQG